LFEAVAREWHDKQKVGWTEKHANRVWKMIESELLASLGARPIREISAPELRAVMRTIESARCT
jgi:hypothetical protein